MFGNKFPESQGFIAMPVTSCIKDTMFQFIPIQLVKGDEIIRLCDRHSNESATLRTHVTKDKLMRKWMVKFLRKFENRGIKIARVNSIASPTQSIYFNFVRCWGPVVMLTFLN